MDRAELTHRVMTAIRQACALRSATEAIMLKAARTRDISVVLCRFVDVERQRRSKGQKKAPR